ncbi:hypothetical protein [Gluconobacter cerinus]|uniref:hypothetical protein n=1 Tax=Gluconobacter cerinus TaxID=38307 RepID=UPI001C05B44C|nr:hypothetical protein [Gluconobacter cerinus]
MSEAPITFEEIRRRGFDSDVMYSDNSDCWGGDFSAQEAIACGDIFSKREKEARDVIDRKKYEASRKALSPSGVEAIALEIMASPNPALTLLLTEQYPIKCNPKISAPKDAKP